MGAGCIVVSAVGMQCCTAPQPQGLTPTEYVQSILEDRPLSVRNMEGIKGQNWQRSIIRGVFNQRACRVLPHPGCDTTQMENLPDSKLSEGFVKVGRRRGLHTLLACACTCVDPAGHLSADQG
jgi:hypothetical protein